MRESPDLSGVSEASAGAKGSFATGLLLALPLSLVAWLVFFWLV